MFYAEPLDGLELIKESVILLPWSYHISGHIELSISVKIRKEENGIKERLLFARHHFAVSGGYEQLRCGKRDCGNSVGLTPIRF